MLSVSTFGKPRAHVWSCPMRGPVPWTHGVGWVLNFIVNYETVYCCFPEGHVLA